jgi:hypothetical protein
MTDVWSLSQKTKYCGFYHAVQGYISLNEEANVKTYGAFWGTPPFRLTGQMLIIQERTIDVVWENISK